MTTDLASNRVDLTGAWQVTHHVVASDRSRFVGLAIDFQVVLSQDGHQLAGDGEKFLVDRQPALREEVSRLAFTGWLDGDEVRISLMEVKPHGPDQAIIGEIVWKVVDADHLLGHFRVDLADTTGHSEAVRVVTS